MKIKDLFENNDFDLFLNEINKSNISEETKNRILEIELDSLDSLIAYQKIHCNSNYGYSVTPISTSYMYDVYIILRYIQRNLTLLVNIYIVKKI